jgi:hypothetical protein
MFDHGETIERGLKFLERRTQKNFDEKLPLIYLKAAKKFDKTKFKFERVTTNVNEIKILENYFNSLNASNNCATCIWLKKRKTDF